MNRSTYAAKVKHTTTLNNEAERWINVENKL